MTYEQAKAVVIGGKGKFGGKSMGEVAVESPSSLDYFASSYRGHNNLGSQGSFEPGTSKGRLIIKYNFPQSSLGCGRKEVGPGCMI